MSEEGKTEGAEEYVSTAPETSAIQSGGATTASAEARAKGAGGKKKKKAEKSHPWRDNIEAIAVSIVTIVLFKYFVLEAYRIPTGSMQPTLMGNDETGIYDRVIVDKLSYHFRDPDRFEVVVFRYPLESNKNFIKRIVGMPGEDMRLEGGDVFVRPLGGNESEWRVLRRPRPIQEAQLRLLEAGEGAWVRFAGAEAEWEIEGDTTSVDIAASGAGRLVYPRASNASLDTLSGSIRDHYTDGYPEGLKDDINVRPGASARNNVGDVRMAATVRADAGTEAVRFIVHEGRTRALAFVLPGPAAAAGESARIEAAEASLPGGAGAANSEPAFRLEAGDSVRVEVQNLNDLLELRIDGELVASLEITPWVADEAVTVEVDVDAADGARTEVSDLRVWRDIYYIAENQKRSSWSIPEDSYVVLGDNSQDSSDGRDWQLTGFEVLEGERAGDVILGNRREINGRLRNSGADRNPWRRKLESGEEVIFFRDDKGERHVFDPDEVRRVDAVDQPFVPRDLIRGRAVLVVWPFSIKRDVYRWKWVR